MGKIVNFMKIIRNGITSKRIMLGFAILLIALLVAFVLIVLSDSAIESAGNLLGTQDNKTKTIHFIGWAMGGVLIAIGLLFLFWTESQAEYYRFIKQRYMGEIKDLMKKTINSITSKQIVVIFTILLVVLFAVLVSVIFFNGVAEWIGNSLDTKGNKMETIQFIGKVMGGTLSCIVLVILSRWWAEFKITMEYMKRMICGIISKQRTFAFNALFIVLLVVLVPVILSDSATEWAGNLFSIDRIISKRIMFGFALFLIVLFVVHLLDSIEGEVVGNLMVRGLSISLIVLLVILLLVIFSSDVALLIGQLLGTVGNKSNKIDTIELLGWAISGVFVTIGSTVLNQLTKAQTNAAEAQVENNRLVEKGHTQERFKSATEHLGDDNASVRISAFYEFLYLIRDNRNEYGKSVLDILYAHIRTTTTNSVYKQEALKRGNSIKPTEEIQGLLDILFKFEEIRRDGIIPNLQRVYLSGADLADGDLSDADLRRANLSEADLSRAKLPRVKLLEADMSGANLSEADLSRAKLLGANMSRAKLSGADLSRVDLSEAKLSRAKLSRADLSGANLPGADLSEASLYETNLSGARLNGTKLFGVNWFGANLSRVMMFGVDLSGAKLYTVNLSEAKLYQVDLSGADLPRVNLSEARLYKTDLSGVNLSEADLSGADLSGADLSSAQLRGAQYTNETQFPEWFVPPIAPPDNGDKVQFPEGFVAPEKSKSDK